MFSITFDPVWPAPAGTRWFWTVAAIVWLAALSLWAYFGVWSATDARRRLILILRLAAVAMIGLAMLRPAIVYAEKSKQSAVLIVLADRSRSMLIEDAVGDRPRWESLKQALERSDAELKALAEHFQVASYGFSEQLTAPLDLTSLPDGQQTAIGDALEDAGRRHLSQRIVGMLLLSDGAQRALSPRDLPPRAARVLTDRRVPLYCVGFGQPSLTGSGRDVVLRDAQSPPAIFVKNNLEVAAQVYQRGFQDQPIRVRLSVEDSDRRSSLVQTAPPVRSKKEEEQLPVRLRWVPELPGEYKLTVEAEPLPGEAISKNNVFSTFVTVLKGGLGVLYLEGSLRPHEPQFIRRALDESPDIRLDRFVLPQPWRSGSRQVQAEWFRPGRYDVYVLGDLDADTLSPRDWGAIRDAVHRGAGLIMIGGYHSFGPGGHAESALAEVLPIQMHPRERQRRDEPPRSDMHFNKPLQLLPTDPGLRYVMRLSAEGNDRELWQALPPLDGANRFSVNALKPGAEVLAESEAGDPLLVAQEVGPGRVLAFAGDTTYRWALDGKTAEHSRFWRQVILWLAHKDEASEGNVDLQLNQRRFRMKEKVEITATLKDAKGQPIPDAQFEVTVEPPGERRDKVSLRSLEGEARGDYYSTDAPGDYRVRVAASREGRVVGTAQARFLVYEEDLEWDNPADLALLQSLADQTGGQYVPPEELPRFLRELRRKAGELHYVRPKTLTLWDRWPFFLLFVAVLSLEWFLRKRCGLA